ncbi:MULTISPECIES: LysR family transcriptional regulator [Pseudoxanthomonas]|jgi:DNA-binding transcriptional LysR family regulator|uniref:LysR family transcriptional regulator n=1 Tax=Pseudoxanthomonas TaxID=83618 RepID=UPI00161D2E0E|nr:MULTISPECIES: LysR family transcriptional regulator [Pseudoxanthomonas]MBB3276849.1 DNA-binding transcriptional LysR family regulator [Pseudoxanthomonas sp. OG2]MBD9376850.1 LysR family transcriptional regulator [Pseudoxanthomonas sp. PXM04]MBV7475859.1 LysR family transcriptional regulator [Pseudoxanthomonas sp. PXM05]UBB26791.1 LysR family transcriptional regulator [Pseudoxanthomonas japonensis]
MSINCEILDLRAFLLVSETRSFHRAAETLHLSQPALSRRIQKLEQNVGAPLLERTTRHVVPTALGQDLLPLVRRLIEEFDGSLFSLRGSDQHRGGQVTIACLPTAAFYFLPSVIARFQQDHPQVRFRILDLPATEGLQSVERGEVEFGINFMGASDPDLIFDTLVEDPFVLACRRDHPLARKRKVSWSDLAPHRLITVHRTSGNRTLLDGALARENLRLNWFYEVTHLSTSLGLVEAGVGISVLPKMATPRGEHATLVTRPLANPVVSRTIGVVRRRGAQLSPVAEEFLHTLKRLWKGG